MLKETMLNAVRTLCEEYGEIIEETDDSFRVELSDSRDLDDFEGDLDDLDNGDYETLYSTEGERWGVVYVSIKFVGSV